MSNASPALDRAAAVLGEHPWIADARADPSSGVVRVRPADSALTVGAEPGPLVVEYLDHWGEIYDWTYTNADVRHAADLDLSGWKASDTGLPFAVEHMTEWVEHTVDLILEGRPDTVVELGCGTGLLAHRLRERVPAYVGTDVAHVAVRTLNAAKTPGTAFVRAAAHEARSDRVRAALDSIAGAGTRPDCVVLNSVTQCFGDLRYLSTVLHDAIALVRPGGRVVVGDVRHAGLLPEYCRWLERTADPEASPHEIQERAAARAARDDELLFDPATLAAIAADSPREVWLSVRAKGLREHTELTRYRFDAVLTVDATDPPAEPPTVSWADLAARGEPTAELARTLATGPVRVTGIPNGSLVAQPDAVPARELREIGGEEVCVAMDAADPYLLCVVTPWDAAARPAGELAGPGRAHEPLWTFVERRLGEVARSHLRRTAPDARGVPIAVEIPPGRGALP